MVRFGGGWRGALKSGWGGWGLDHGREWKLSGTFLSASAGVFRDKASPRFEYDLSELVECTGQLSETVSASDLEMMISER